MPKFFQTFINWLKIVIYSLIIIAILFLAFMNRQLVNIKFFFDNQWNISLAIIIFTSVLLGLILGFIGSWINSYTKIKQKEKSIKFKLEKHFTKKIQELENSIVTDSSNHTSTEVVSRK